MKSKKGYIFSLVLVIFTFIILITMLYFIVDDPFASRRGEYGKIGLGKRALILMNTYQQGEQTLLYVDVAAQHSARQSAVELAADGGFIREPPCGKENDYALWNGESENCVPPYERNFFSEVNKNLNQFLKNNDVEQQRYGFYSEGTQLVGTATRDITFTQDDLVYAVRPSFNINSGYDVIEYEELTEKSELMRLCSGMVCVKEKVKGSSLQWKTVGCDFSNFIACFDVVGGTFPFYGDVVYKFALSIDFPAIVLNKVHDAGNAVIIEFEASIKEDVEKYIVSFSSSEENLDNNVEFAFDNVEKLVKFNPEFSAFELGKVYESVDEVLYYKFSPDAGAKYFSMKAVNDEGRVSDEGNVVG